MLQALMTNTDIFCPFYPTPKSFTFWKISKITERWGGEMLREEPRRVLTPTLTTTKLYVEWTWDLSNDHLVNYVRSTTRAYPETNIKLYVICNWKVKNDLHLKSKSHTHYETFKGDTRLFKNLEHIGQIFKEATFLHSPVFFC